MIKFLGYWVGRNKGCLDNDILIGKLGRGGISLKLFVRRLWFLDRGLA